MTDSNSKPKNFYMRTISRAKVGTVAVFGVDERIYEHIAQSIQQIHTNNPCVMISYQGTDVPEPDYEVEDTEVDLSRREDLIHERFSNYSVRLVKNKLFLIVYLEGVGDNGEAAWAYVNIRSDRWGRLFTVGLSENLFDIGDYSTIVMTGSGSPTIEEMEKLQQGYLFGNSHINMRVFPPLDEVT
jgi:hypothetical protein